MALTPTASLGRFAPLADGTAALARPPRDLPPLGRLAVTARALSPLARLLPRRDRRLVQAYWLVRGTGLFDQGWYGSRYLGAARAGSDPLRRFLERGAALGHPPSPAWEGLGSDACRAFAERHGKAGRALWRHMRAERGPRADGFLTSAPTTSVGPLTVRAFAGAVEDPAGPGGPLGVDLLIVDHAMGGGANRFRDRRISAAVGSGLTVGLLTYHVHPPAGFQLELGDGCTWVGAAAANLPEVEGLLRHLAARAVLVNNLVSYPDVRATIEILRRHAGRWRSPVEVPVHDYFAVCPSFNLLDDRRAFCGVPALPRCRECLARLELPEPVRGAPRDIDAWRDSWAGLLDEAARVTCFSASSSDLLARGFPELDPKRVEVRPHRVDYLPERAPVPTRGAELHLGVVGEISFAKGAAVVEGLAELIRRTGSPVRLSVIGTLDKRHAVAGVPQTGRYRPEDLPGLIAELGVNLCLVPSVWPETFCYVAEELIRLGMPVAAFDLGAPAERLRGYPQGLVMQSQEPQRVLAELQAFWRTLSRPDPASAVAPARRGSLATAP